MIRRALLAATIFGAFVAPAGAVSTTAVLLTTTWLDLGAGPLQLQTNNNSLTVYQVADVMPPAGASGFLLQGLAVPQIVTTPGASHVWVRERTPQANVVLAYAPAVLATGGTGGGGGTAADQTGTNATDAQATSTANQHALAFGYIFNGTTWDRIRGTGGAANVFVQNFPATQAVTWTNQTVGISGTVQLGAGAAAIGSVSISNFPTTQAVSLADGADIALGTRADTAYSGSGSATAISVLKGIYSLGGQPVSLTANGSLVSTAAPLPTTLSNLNTNGQKTMANSSPVVISSDQSSLPVLATQAGTWNITNITGTVSLPTGASTAALQSSVQSAAGTASGTALTVQGNASGVPLPTTLQNLNSNGQKTSANSSPVVLPSDQSPIPVVRSTAFTDSQTALAASGAFTGTSHATGVAQGSPGIYSYFGVNVTSDQAGTLFVEGSIDNTTFYAENGTAGTALTAGATQTVKVPITMPYQRVRFTNGGTAQTKFSLTSAFSGS